MHVCEKVHMCVHACMCTRETAAPSCGDRKHIRSVGANNSILISGKTPPDGCPASLGLRVVDTDFAPLQALALASVKWVWLSGFLSFYLLLPPPTLTYL